MATDELTRALVHVRQNTQMQRLLQGVDETIGDELKTALTAMKAEYAAVYALSLFSPDTRIPDPSRAGRDRDSKWYADGGTFVVWSIGRQGYVPLSDTQGVRAQLLRVQEALDDDDVGGGNYVDCLKLLELSLVNLPGDFGDFEARIAAKVATLEAELKRILQVTIADGRQSPFHPASNEGDEAGAAAVRKPAVGGSGGKKRR